MIEEALLGALEGRARGRLGLAVERAALASDVGGLQRRIEIVMDDLEGARIGIVDAGLLVRELVLDELVLDALEGERAGGRETVRSRAITSMAATPPASIASTNSARVAKGKSAPPQSPRRWA